jgi:putative DNA primase/helicase
MDVAKTIGEIANSLPNLGGLGQNDKRIDKYTEAKIAHAITDAISSLPFRRGEGSFFHYEDGRYVKVINEKLGNDEMSQIILGVMEELNIGDVYMFGSISMIKEMIANSYKIPDFRPSKSIISFQNCVLNTADMKTMPHNPECMTRIFFDFDYDPKATCHLWESFLTQVLPDDYEGRLILQEFLGFMFINKEQLSEEKSLFLYGTGSNGKSVVQDVIQSMLGNDNCSNYELSQLCTASDAGYNLADINGKLLNFASDMGDKDFSSGRFNTIIKREPIQVNRNGQHFKAKDIPLLISSINKLPDTKKCDTNYWDNFLLIHFPIAESDQDRLLKLRLKGEISGIFNWILVGRDRLLKNNGKFTKSPHMEMMIGTAKKESNSVLAFLEEKNYTGLESGIGLVTRMEMFSREIMSEYSEYCRLWKNTPKSKTNFINDLKSAGFEYKAQMRKGGEVSSGFRFNKKDPNYGDTIA